MMHYYDPGMGAGGWVLMALGLVAFWGLVIALILTVNRVWNGPRPVGPGTGDPERVLADRFARGDIDAEEYERRLRILRDPRP
jgi:putative membrane protein